MAKFEKYTSIENFMCCPIFCPESLKRNNKNMEKLDR